MRLGLFGINFGPCADPVIQACIAVAAEESGFESIWTGEHVAMPVRDSPVPIPPETPFLDSIATLTNVAAGTYYVVVDSANSQAGHFGLSISAQ